MMHVSKFLVNPNLSQSFSSSLQNCALWFCFTEKVKVVVLHTQKNSYTEDDDDQDGHTWQW